jgi:hypothetical protein
MKKIILSVLSSIFISTFGFGTKFYVRVCQDGGESGYARVSNTTNSDEQGNTWVSIGCFDPGTSECPRAISPSDNTWISANVQNICANYALSQIGNNVFSGSTQIQITGEGNFQLSWSSYNAYGYTSTINITSL